MYSVTLSLILATTLVLAWAGTGLIIHHAVRWGLEDVPNQRSSHTRITPRGGGAAIVVAGLAGVLLLVLTACILPALIGNPNPYTAAGSVMTPGGLAHAPAVQPSWWRIMLHQDLAWLGSISGLASVAFLLLLPGLVLGVLGLMDDRRGLSIRLRLGFQIAAVVWLLATLYNLMGGAGIFWQSLSALWDALGSLGVPGMQQDMARSFAGGHDTLPLLLAGITGTALIVAGVWWINLYNFMDGIDGIAASQALFMLLGAVLLRSLVPLSPDAAAAGGKAAACLLSGVVPPQAGQLLAPGGLFECIRLEHLMTDPSSTLSLILAASVTGFLFWNWAPARIFMGDAGSLFLGYVLMAIAGAETVLWLREYHQAIATGVNPGSPAHVVYGVPPASWLILGSVFIIDATVTLVRRILSGQRVGDPHRSHVYQRLSRRFGSHARATLVYCLINVLWLLPLAAIARLQPGLGMSMLLLAWAPLVLLAWALGAGRTEPVS